MMKSVRDEFGDTLVELGRMYEDLVVLDADLSRSTRTYKFAQKYPERFFNIGISEQDLMSTAAGLALEGKIPVASTYAVFAGRAWEQMRNTVARSGLNVKIVVTHAGFSNSSDGSSHQSVEDIAIVRAIPGMTLIVPSDAVEMRGALRAAVEFRGPVYIRLGRDAPQVFDESYQYELGRSVLLRDGKDVTVVATGIMVGRAIQAAELLKERGISVCVLDVHTIKPLDGEGITRAAAKTGAVVTAEEHSVIGGLGGAVSELLSENLPVPIERVGVKDMYGQSGEYEQLLTKHRLTSNDVAAACIRAIDRKRVERS